MVAMAEAPGQIGDGTVGRASCRVRVLVVNRKHPPVWLSRGMLESQPCGGYRLVQCYLDLSYVTRFSLLTRGFADATRYRTRSRTTHRTEVRQARSREPRRHRQTETRPGQIPRFGLRTSLVRVPGRMHVCASMRRYGEQCLTQGMRAWAEVVALSPPGPGSRHTDRSGGKPFKEGGFFCASRGTTVVRVPAALRLPVVQ